MFGRHWYLISFCYRYNLDPERQKTDDEVWKALEIAQLKPIITALPSQLGKPYPPQKIHVYGCKGIYIGPCRFWSLLALLALK